MTKNKAKGKVSKSVNACVKVAPTPCPGCNGQHSFQSKGETLYKTYLSACEVFRSMIVAERARIVERSKACQLCLDWTGTHQRDQCKAVTKGGQPYGVCEAQDNGVVCGLKHNKMLHGSTVRYCNVVHVHNMVKERGTSLCVLDSMCPCLYVSISLCVQGSMWQISCRIDPLWLWFYVSRVLCGPGSMWPLMYKLTLCVVGPMCPGSNVTNALCVHGSMWP